MRQPTIVDVAKMARVSTATVSRVLNNNYPVSPKTRQAVEDAIRALEYDVNLNARNLKLERSHMIGMIAADISNPFFLSIARGVESVTEAQGYRLVFANNNESVEKEAQMLRMFKQYRVDGVLLASCGNAPDHINDIIGTSLPCVLVDSYIRGVNADVVADDDKRSMATLVEHLIEHGHRRICLVNGNADKITAIERHEGYAAALAAHGIPLREAYLLDGAFRRDRAEAAFDAFLDDVREPPTAVVCANNTMAEGVLAALLRRGWRVPDVLSVASYDDISVPGLYPVRIAHLRDNAFDIGAQAGRFLLRDMSRRRERADAYRVTLFERKLVHGGSMRRIDPQTQPPIKTLR